MYKLSGLLWEATSSFAKTLDMIAGLDVANNDGGGGVVGEECDKEKERTTMMI